MSEQQSIAEKARIHNETVKKAVTVLVEEPLKEGCNFKDILTITESVVAAVIMTAAAKPQGRAVVTAALLGGISSKVEKITQEQIVLDAKEADKPPRQRKLPKRKKT